ncbi:CDP-glycerol glycerophosphotransferase family protein [Demequina sp.]|uniref:CDP-glycerol glycerophosphotransferase family protein n=1 Tax=Demequina sp. TaxID=2050685 RepID=UPI003A861CDA
MGVNPSRIRAQRAADARVKARQAPLVDQVLYESYYGAGVLCSPEAIFREVVDAPDLAHLHHVWVLRDKDVAPRTVAEFALHPRVRFITYRSDEYTRELSRSRYVVNNSTWPRWFVKREGQVSVNTWHGTPLKRMGFDQPEGVRGASNTLRAFLQADYLIAPNRFTADTMFRGAYRLDGIYGGAILETGYPRADIQTRLAHDPAAARQWLSERGVTAPAGARTVLIAPTWKGETFQRPVDDADDWATLVAQLQERLGDGYFVMVKLHQAVAGPARHIPSLRGRLVGTEVSTNGVLAATDLLVTDFSSLFFDYLSLRRPIVFHMPDQADYTASRGTYLDPEDLPGPRTTTLDELAAALVAAATADPVALEWSQRVDQAADLYAAHDDGAASARVADVVFRDADPTSHQVPCIAADQRPRLLIHVGGLLSNGITTSAMNLLSGLDYDRFDVSLTYRAPTNAARWAELAKADPRARPIEIGLNIAEDGWQPRRKRAGRALPPESTHTLESIRTTFGTEWRRTFGTAQFDHIVDFSGYSPLTAALMLCGNAKSHSIWLHNDLVADRERMVDGHMPHWDSLGQTFELYPLYDHLVSVSPALRDINRERLARYAPAEAFTASVNTIDFERVMSLRSQVEAEREALSMAESPADAEHAAARRAMLATHDGMTTFATVGRVSPEKNHERLIRAFAQVAHERADVRLALLGNGALVPHLQEVAQDSGIADRVLFLGHTSNPFVYLDRADCFVLSSDYEGQPMVILEARTLGLPIISTRFGSVDSALPERTGLVVERSVDDLADGMRAFLEGKVPTEPFDPVSYNRAAIEQFYSAIGAA